LKSLKSACENCGENSDILRLEIPMDNWMVNNDAIEGHSFTFILEIMENVRQIHNIIGSVDE